MFIFTVSQSGVYVIPGKLNILSVGQMVPKTVYLQPISGEEPNKLEFAGAQ